MPSRPKKDTAKAMTWTIAHTLVATDAGVLDGWSRPTNTKRIPATMADNPDKRMRFGAVVVISRSLWCSCGCLGAFRAGSAGSGSAELQAPHAPGGLCCDFPPLRPQRVPQPDQR